MRKPTAANRVSRPSWIGTFAHLPGARPMSTVSGTDIVMVGLVISPPDSLSCEERGTTNHRRDLRARFWHRSPRRGGAGRRVLHLHMEVGQWAMHWPYSGSKV